MFEVKIAEAVFHPTDFSEASERAFADALAIAVLSGARIDVFHAGPSLAQDWQKFPAVRATLERWGLLPAGSPRSAVFERLGVAVTKAELEGSPTRACLRAIQESDPDLVVLATEGRNGIARWLRPSVAEAILHRTRASTLFVPVGGRNLVSPEDGEIRVGRILVAVADRPSPDAAIAQAERFALALGTEGVTIEVLRVNGPVPKTPESRAPELEWRGVTASGDVVEQILTAAHSSDVIVVATEGSHGIWDALRGSTTSRIVQGAVCPVLAVPAR